MARRRTGIDGGKPTDLTSYPEQRHRALTACTRILAEFPGEKPAELHGDAMLRATWWVDYMLEGPSYPSERPQRTRVAEGKDGVVEGLVEPYVVRVEHYLRKFLGLDDGYQRYILAAREDSIWWRGDDLEFFRIVVENSMRWRELDDDGKAKWKADAIAKAKAVVRKALRRFDSAAPSQAVNVGAERERQLDKLYRLMTPEQRARFDDGMETGRSSTTQ